MTVRDACGTRARAARARDARNSLGGVWLDGTHATRHETRAPARGKDSAKTLRQNSWLMVTRSTHHARHDGGQRPLGRAAPARAGYGRRVWFFLSTDTSAKTSEALQTQPGNMALRSARCAVKSARARKGATRNKQADSRRAAGRTHQPGRPGLLRAGTQRAQAVTQEAGSVRPRKQRLVGPQNHCSSSEALASAQKHRRLGAAGAPHVRRRRLAAAGAAGGGRASARPLCGGIAAPRPP